MTAASDQPEPAPARGFVPPEFEPELVGHDPVVPVPEPAPSRLGKLLHRRKRRGASHVAGDTPAVTPPIGAGPVDPGPVVAAPAARSGMPTRPDGATEPVRTKKPRNLDRLVLTLLLVVGLVSLVVTGYLALTGDGWALRPAASLAASVVFLVAARRRPPEPAFD
ncbi:MAG: hypothetical protein R2734_14325 [Nocardioides sp.]